LAEADELPLGSGAIAGTAYAIDVRALADALGFARVARNSMDVSGDRDFVASFLHAASLGMVHLSRVARISSCSRQRSSVSSSSTIARRPAAA